LKRTTWLHGAAGASLDGWAGVTLVTNRPFAAMLITRRSCAVPLVQSRLPATLFARLVQYFTIAVRDYTTRFRTSATPPQPHLGFTDINLPVVLPGEYSAAIFRFLSSIELHRPAHCGSLISAAMVPNSIEPAISYLDGRTPLSDIDATDCSPLTACVT
jgi:hypothetical protein